MDHGGGMNTFLKLNTNSKIYTRPDAFSAHTIKAFGKDYPVGVDLALKKSPQILLTKSVQVIDKELQVFSSPCGNILKPMFNSTLYAEKNGLMVEDDFSHEQSLIITEGETTVLVGGCAHGGILNLLNKAEELIGRSVDFVVSGFHLYDPPTKNTEPESRIDELAAELSKYSTGQSILGVNSKSKVKFVEDEFETIVSLVTTMDADTENMFISVESDLEKALMGKKLEMQWKLMPKVKNIKQRY